MSCFSVLWDSMKLLILGSTGKTGQQLVKFALEKNHEVTVLVRDRTKIPVDHPHFSVVEGNVLDQKILEQAVRGKDAVLSSLGVGASFKSNNLVGDAAALLVPVMQGLSVNRLIFVSAFGVGDTVKHANFIQKLFFKFLLKDIYTDKEKADNLIMKSDLDWTIIFPVKFTDGPLTGKVKAGEMVRMKGMPSISRADAAAYIVDHLMDPGLSQKRVIIMKA